MPHTSNALVEAEFVPAMDAAKLLSCSRWSLYALAAKGHLPAFTFPGTRSLRFRLADVRAVLQPREAQRPSAEATVTNDNAALRGG